jgi:hypothetical protein
MEMFENTQVLQGSLSKYKAMSVLYRHDFYNNMEQRLKHHMSVIRPV